MKVRFILVFFITLVLTVVLIHAITKENIFGKINHVLQDYTVEDDVDKIILLGNMYYDGNGISTSQDYDRAFDLYLKAAKQGNAEAQYNTGVMYYRGEGVPVDYKEAKKWFERSAEQYNSDAQFSLGVIYYQGDGVTKNLVYAERWFKDSCENGNESGCEKYSTIGW